MGRNLGGFSGLMVVLVVSWLLCCYSCFNASFGGFMDFMSTKGLMASHVMMHENLKEHVLIC